MRETLESLPDWAELLKPFEPIARYYETMDVLLYLNMDTSYRAERVDGWLTMLWHPYKRELVGIQLKGFRAVCRRNSLLTGIAHDDSLFLPLASLVATHFLKDEAQALIAAPNSGHREALMRKYDEALAFVARENARVSIGELRRAA